MPVIHNRIALVLLVATLCCTWPLQAQVYFADDGVASFTSSVPLHTFTGTSKALVGRVSLADSTVDFYLDLTTLDTGIGKRDKDMRRTLETDRYPFAEFFGKLSTTVDPGHDGRQAVIVTGDFTIHGVTRRVEIEGALEFTGDGLIVNAAWDLNLEDYDIVPPSLLIVKVDEVQKIQIDAKLEQE